MTAKPMTKTQLVAELAAAAGIEKAAAGRALDALAAIVAGEIEKGGAVTIPGIGKVFVRERPARTVRNPATGATIEKPADKAVKITVAKKLKDVVAG
ncbi:MAG: HU family DNA-binding protein [Alphaproteobacteria bacterium]|nr:MAG: HU family DNA-binding protein [Alphaproteobacteria bacterium]